MSTSVIKDTDAIASLSGKNSLRDGTIRRFDIYEIDHVVTVDVYVDMRRGASFPKAKLQFIECVEYALDFSNGGGYYTIPQLKFFKTDIGLYYFSFHPWDEQETVSDKDEDLIVSKHLILHQSWDSDDRPA